MIIVDPIAIAVPPTIGGAAGAGSGGGNLLTPSPREAWVADAVGVSTIDIDLGGAGAVDAFFLGFTNASAAATWRIQRGTGLGTGLTTLVDTSTFRMAGAMGPLYHGFARLDAITTARYFRITVTQTGVDPLFAGVLLAGRAFEAPHELGGGRTPIDTSVIEALPDGGFGVGEGVVKGAVKWTFVGLRPAERRRLWQLALRRGNSRPVLVFEGLAEDGGEADELHYGLFDKFEAYEREDPGETRWGLSMTEWV